MRSHAVWLPSRIDPVPCSAWSLPGGCYTPSTPCDGASQALGPRPVGFNVDARVCVQMLSLGPKQRLEPLP